MTRYTIYALIDAREPERFRYVGMTSDLPRRFQEHRTKQYRAPAERWAWIAETGERLQTVVICDEADYEEARKIEWRLIRDRRKQGQCDHNGYSPAPHSLRDEIEDSFLPTDSFADKMARFVA